MRLNRQSAPNCTVIGIVIVLKAAGVAHVQQIGEKHDDALEWQ